MRRGLRTSDVERSLEANLFNLVGAALREKAQHAGRQRWIRRRVSAILFTRDPRLPEPTFGASRAEPVNGVYRAGSDHRKDGQAVGW